MTLKINMQNILILQKQIFLEKEFTNIFGKFESSSILEGVIFEKNSSLNITKILISGFEIVLPGDFKKIGENYVLKSANDLITGPEES